MGMVLTVTSGALATLLAEAERAAPEECCGLLLGEGERIEAAVPAANVAADRLRRFEIDPASLFAAHKAARDGGPQVLGYYHSHPHGPAEPSAQDRAGATRDGRVWAIVAGKTLGWWRDAPGGFEALCTLVLDA
jgi:desampylase